MCLRQAGFAQPARKAQAMHQPEGEGDHPRRARGDSLDATTHVNDLRRDEDDAQRDDRLDRLLRHMDEAERRRRERDAVRDRERGDGLDQFPAAARDDQQRQHEQQMIDAAEDVLDAEHQVGADDRQRSAARPRPRTTERTASAA